MQRHELCFLRYVNANLLLLSGPFNILGFQYLLDRIHLINIWAVYQTFRILHIPFNLRPNLTHILVQLEKPSFFLLTNLDLVNAKKYNKPIFRDITVLRVRDIMDSDIID